jgi:hypothetical protein
MKTEIKTVPQTPFEIEPKIKNSPQNSDIK